MIRVLFYAKFAIKNVDGQCLRGTERKFKNSRKAALFLQKKKKWKFKIKL